MLEKVLSEDHDYVYKFMRKMEFGEEKCIICRTNFVDKPGEFCNHYCSICTKLLDEMWNKFYEISLKEARNFY